MNAFHDLDRQLDQLGRELAGRPSFADSVMAEIATVNVELPRQRWLRAAGTLALAASMLIAAAVWLSPSRSLYAQTIAALAKVKTVHVTGSTSRPFRKWPLEAPVKEQAGGKIAFEAWYWDGTRGPRCYENFGPVTLIRNGSELQEYQSDVDLLYISKGLPKDYVERFSSLAALLEALKKEGAVTEELGVRNDQGKTIRGLKFVRDGARGGATEEFWFDAQTNLPALYVRTQSDNDNRASEFDLRFSYDEQVPEAVASYRPPQTKHVRYGGQHDDVQIVWKQHVQDLGRRMQNEADGEPIAILPRTGGQTFTLQYSTATPDDKYLVVPLDVNQYIPLSVAYFVKQRAATVDGERAIETWRVPNELLEIEFPRADLVFTKDTPWRQWVGFALNSIGLELVEVVEERTYWIAQHDGRRLKPYQRVKPPVPYIVKGGKEQKGLVKPGVGYQLRPVTMHELLEDFNRLQNDDCNGRSPIIVDRTGLPRPPQWDRSKHSTWEQYRSAVDFDRYLVATDAPYFTGEESQAMAREWYQKEFGVTFKEEQRKLSMHVIRRKP